MNMDIELKYYFKGVLHSFLLVFVVVMLPTILLDETKYKKKLVPMWILGVCTPYIVFLTVGTIQIYF